jgi:hypothetical protein
MFVLMALLYAFAGFKTYEYTESDTFCGVLCHSSGSSIHRAENLSYSFSPHANVGCSTCHVGSGAKYFILYKLRGMRQLFNLVTDRVPRPIHTPVADLRPAKEVCESCHGPKYQFYERLEARKYFRRIRVLHGCTQDIVVKGILWAWTTRPFTRRYWESSFHGM